MSSSENLSDSTESTGRSNRSSTLGLDLFAQQTTTHERRRYWLHFLVYAVLLSFTVWPVFTPFNRVTPYVLGLPFNMAWNTLVLALVAVNTYELFRFEEGPLFGGEGETSGGGER